MHLKAGCPQKNGRYINPYSQGTMRSPLDAFLWKLGWFDDVLEKREAVPSFSYPSFLEPFDPAKPSVMWVNHSTFLIRFGDLSLLTDPIWNKRCSPLSFLGPQRHHAPGISLKDLPRIDYVLISHDHYDHLDKRSVIALYKKDPAIQWLVPQGVKKWFYAQGIHRVIEFSWWEEAVLSHPFPLKATFVPAQHFSGRKGFDLNKTLWGGWVFEFDKIKTVYFTGDTGYNPVQFKEIGAQWKSVDLSLIPIGCYVPRTFMSPVHIDPAEAVKIHRDVGSKFSLGMHWKTFLLGDEALDRPPYDLYQALQEEGIDLSSFRVIKPGQQINW